jgi:hypothetical protein
LGGGAAAARQERRERVGRFRRRVEDDRFERNSRAAQVIGDHRRVDEHGACTGVRDDVAHVVERGGRVDRHAHPAGEKDAEVGENPIDAVGRKQRDAVARDEPIRAERGGDRRHAFQYVLRAERVPVRARIALVEQRPVGSRERVAHEFNERHTRRTSAKTRSRPGDFDQQ